MDDHDIEYYINHYGEPLLSFSTNEITDFDRENKDQCNMPDEVYVFKINYPPGVMVVSTCLGKAFANYGSREAIYYLIQKIKNMENGG